MRIALDLDGVICNIRRETEFRFSKEFGGDAWDKVKDYLHTSKAPGVPDGWMRRQFEDPAFWLNGIATEDGYLMANKWFSEGHDVFIVTARYPSEMEVTSRWLEEWDIIVTDLISQPILTKDRAVEKLNLDIFVEDNPEEAKIISQKIPTFLVDRSYNKNGDDGNAIRVSSLYDVDKVVNKWPLLKLNVRDVKSLDILRNLIENTNMIRSQKRG